MINVEKLIELIKLADKIIEIIDVPVLISEEAKHKKWLESGYAISAYRTARSNLKLL